MSNLGRWDRWYSGLEFDPQPYGDTDTYKKGADWLRSCDLIEDWGCGKGWFSKFVKRGQYRGLDGSWSPWAEEIVDLVHYQSRVEGIYMRHVLEHDYQWHRILENALASFQKRMALVLFTPLSDATHEIAFAEDPGVPDISFSLDDLTFYFGAHDVEYTYETLETATQYKTETIFYLEKS